MANQFSNSPQGSDLGGSLHMQQLTSTLEQSLWSSLKSNLRDTFFPEKLPPLKFDPNHPWWRTTEDINDHYDRMSVIGFDQDGLEPFAGPGHWNDPDMLEVGNGGMNHDEYVTHMSLWALLAAPLLAGNDLSKMTPETLSILTNKEVVAVDQDGKGTQGRRVAQEGPLEVWAKPLADGSIAVGLFNRGESTNIITLSYNDIGVQGSAMLRDLWQHKDLGSFSGSYTEEVPRHGAVMIVVRVQ